ncbi:hypothetical protein ACYKV8_001882 [Enterococcus hirae]|uniref:hypothetical protein n=1 Tax=Enterococcus TaxID=1350 RepID=UPI00046E4573|nr:MULTISPECIES: hypothetical protein [Enterococcus]MDB1686017.1 hypothetical protein [Enterococcus durans]RDG07721.1 hypothetical protein DQM18_13405 [Enterococcus faecium]HAQ5735649.1 hypothetical protein [Enterococcus faecium]
MNVLGIRVEPKIVHYTIISDKDEFTVDNLYVPVNMGVPRRLSYIRSNLLSIVKENQISKIGLRIIESNADLNTIQNVGERINIEGVIQELMCDCNISVYRTFLKSQILKSLNLKKRSVLDDYLNTVSNYPPFGIDLETWNRYSKNQKESILVAFSVRGIENV